MQFWGIAPQHILPKITISRVIAITVEWGIVADVLEAAESEFGVGMDHRGTVRSVRSGISRLFKACRVGNQI